MCTCWSSVFRGERWSFFGSDGVVMVSGQNRDFPQCPTQQPLESSQKGVRNVFFCNWKILFFSKGAVVGLFGISFLDRRGVELRDRMNNKVLDANGTGISGIWGGGYSFICPHILSVYSFAVVMFCLLPATIVCFFALIVWPLCLTWCTETFCADFLSRVTLHLVYYKLDQALLVMSDPLHWKGW